MTTIAVDAKEGVMCCDSFWTDGTSCGFTKKIFRIRGALLGGAGGSKQLDAWFNAYRKNQPLKGDEIHVLRLHPNGKIDNWYKADGWSKVEQKQFAIGTGGNIARGAMAAGATCARAVKISSDIDAETGGPVRTYRLYKGPN